MDEKSATTLANLLSELTVAGIGSAFGSAGGATAASVDINNRQLHLDKQLAVLKKLATNADGQFDQDEYNRLVAAACFIVRCADGVPPSDPNYAPIQQLQSVGSTFTNQIDLLKQQTVPVTVFGLCDLNGFNCAPDSIQNESLFAYSAADRAIDYCTSTTNCTRAVGVVQLAGGALGFGASATAGGVTCPESAGIGCALAIVGVATSADIFVAGVATAGSGQLTVPIGEQVLKSFDLTKDYAGLIYYGLNMVSSFGAGVAAAVFDEAAASSVVTVYRVEGSLNQRLVIGQDGTVGIIGDGKMLFLNFGDAQRAQEFLAKRLSQDMSDATIKTFNVPQSFLVELRASAVPESAARLPESAGKPILVDTTKAVDQFGLRPDQITALKAVIIQGSGK